MARVGRPHSQRVASGDFGRPVPAVESSSSESARRHRKESVASCRGGQRSLSRVDQGMPEVERGVCGFESGVS